jgi:pimeloyl-ACP methyl ester carboxylesterase/DNA-binding CsgD family transcriptional regulator
MGKAMDNETLSELIGLIYDVASDADLWPRLLEILAQEFEPLLAEEAQEQALTGDPKRIHSQDGLDPFALSPSKGEPGALDSLEQKEIPSSQSALISLLRSHVTRALTLNRRIFEAREERKTVEDLLERLPMGMMIVDSESHVLAYNQKLDQIVSGGIGISLTGSILSVSSSNDTARLRRMIHAAANGDEKEGKAINISLSDSAMPLAALVLPFKTDASPPGIGSNQALVFIAAPEIHLDISTETLMALYELTRAEARLVSALVKGRSLNSIADEFGLSKHTLRTQLKSVYEKTGTHRQAELVRQVITGPAMLATLGRKEEKDASTWSASKRLPPGGSSGRRTGETVRLPDNRLLGYAEYGVTNGSPVMFMHAICGSRLGRHPDESIVKRCGVRLIIPERPGVGLSDSRRDMTLLDWADDVEALADHLGLKRFSVLASSAGGAFGLACAYRLEERIRRVVLVGTMAPFSSIWELGGMNAPFRLLLCLGRHAPSLVGPLLGLIGFQRRPQMIYAEVSKQVDAVDHALLRDTRIRERLMEDMKENLRQGDHQLAREIALLSRDWGFELSGVRVPVELWHGELDRIVPPRMVEKLAAALPNCRLTRVRGSGHALLFHCWEKVLRAAISTGS